MTVPAGPPSPQVRPAAALAYATIGFVTLLIAGWGLTSLFLDAEVVAVPGLGAVPGVVGTVIATGAFAGSTWMIVRRTRPRYTAVVVVTAAAFLAHLGGLWLGALFSGVDLARAAAAVGTFATSPFALVLLASAFVCGWIAVALVRTRASRPRWPWERDDDEP